MSTTERVLDTTAVFHPDTYVHGVPHELFAWSSLGTARGWIAIAGGGFLVGFGTAYAGGCTSGHGISGVANLEVPSFIALGGFFAGGLLGTFVLLPLVLGVGR